MVAYSLRTSLDPWVQTIGNSNHLVPQKFTGKEFHKKVNAFLFDIFYIYYLYILFILYLFYYIIYLFRMFKKNDSSMILKLRLISIWHFSACQSSF